MLARCRDWASRELADSTRVVGRSEPYVGINDTRASSSCLLIVIAPMLGGYWVQIRKSRSSLWNKLLALLPDNSLDLEERREAGHGGKREITGFS